MKLLYLALVSYVGAQTTGEPCTSGVHIIHARGEPPSGEGQGYGIAIDMVNSIKALIPFSTNASVVYPKTDNALQNNYPGVENEMELISNFTSRCPDTPVVLTGYSEGAGLTMNTVCGSTNHGFNYTAPLSTDYFDNILAVAVYGDYMRPVSASYNEPSCTTGANFARRDYECEPWAPKIHNWCNADDPVCCSTGLNQSTHYTYFKQWDLEMAMWVQQLYLARLLELESSKVLKTIKNTSVTSS